MKHFCSYPLLIISMLIFLGVTKAIVDLG